MNEQREHVQSSECVSIVRDLVVHQGIAVIEVVVCPIVEDKATSS